jgi:chaperone required for assembly of F1-ATPase
MTQRRAERFYKSVTVAGQEGAFVVQLDGKPVKTPDRTPLSLPTRALAEAVAGEWRAQGTKIDPLAMPLTRLANTTAARVPGKRAEIVAQVLAFGRTDVLCYRAEAPAGLVALQAASWDPLLDWADATHGARLAAAAGLAFVEQPAGARLALEKAVSRYDDFALTALAVAASICGSLVLALALADGRLESDEAFALAHLDETWQAGKWGRDPEAEARATRSWAELAAAERFLRLLSA